MRTTIKAAAEKLEVPEQSLRIWIISGKCPFGEVLIDRKSRNGKRTYYICTERLEKYLQGEMR